MLGYSAMGVRPSVMLTKCVTGGKRLYLCEPKHGVLIELSLFSLVALILSDFSDILTMGPEA